jgi:drug/metabolite transporter (DMT)-like permease
MRLPRFPQIFARHPASAALRPADAVLREPRSTRTADFLLLFLLAALWGSSYMFIKIAVVTVTPITLVAVRVTVSAVAMLAYLRVIGVRLPKDAKSWIVISIVGVSGNTFAFLFLAWGVRAIDSGLAAILLSTVPLFTILIAHLFLSDERLTVRNLFGIAIGFSGMVVLAWPTLFLDESGSVVGQILVVLASLSYAVSSVVAARVPDVDPTAAATGSIIAAAFVMVPASLVFDRPWTLMPSTSALWSLAVVAILGTAAAQIVFFRLVHRAGATFMSTSGYLIPLVGVLLGAVVLGEKPDIFAFGALVLILVGVGIVQGRSS